MILQVSRGINAAKVVAVGLSVLFSASLAPCRQDRNPASDKTRYFNYQYGYSVFIPKEMNLSVPEPPAPQHGFEIKLSERPPAVIWVDGSYNAALWRSWNEALEDHLDYLSKRIAVESDILDCSPINLRGLEAVRLVIKYKKRGSDETVREDFIVAMRREKNEPVGVIYELGLRTSESRYEEDKNTFDRICAEWRLEALP